MPTDLFNRNNQDHGFSLIEILVAMFLMVLLLMLATSTSFSNRDKLDEAINNIERAVRFGIDEAALRNVIVRLHFYHDKSPIEYALEYGPSDNFVLPISLTEEDRGTDKEIIKQKAKKFNKNFNRISEFQDSNKKLPDDVKLLGVGSKLSGRLINEFHSSIYIFPTGEKDASILFFGTDEEMASLELEGFADDFSVNYYKLEQDIPEDEIAEKQEELTLELFEKWIK